MSAPYEFEIDQWLSRFPLSTLRRYSIDNPNGPARMCYIEQIRRLAAVDRDLRRTVACDTFVLASGEPRQRDVTKIGGVPYRPRELPWPVSREGVPLVFLAQFRFEESLDIIGRRLPGSVLLIFAEGLAFYPYDQFLDEMHFEWYPLKMQGLVRRQDAPKASERIGRFPICYGYRYRTVDYADWQAVEALVDVVPPAFPLLRPRKECTPGEFERYVQSELCQLSKVKIGGSAFWRYPEDVERRHAAPGRYLCSLPQILSGGEELYPWVNRKLERSDSPSLFFGLEGILHIFIDDNDAVHPRFECFSILDIAPE